MIASIVIRSLNEKDNLIRLLDILDYQDFEGKKEVIIVDNESTDGTLEAVKSRADKILTIKRNKFSYPRALNLGVRNSSGEVIVIVSPHSFPVKKNWLSSGLRHFNDSKVAGVYSPVLAREDASLFQKFFHYFGYGRALIQGVRVVKTAGTGVLGFTNAAVRKSLWDKHNFDESYGMGGEDGEWAGWAIKSGYKIICDPAFVVRHSHKVVNFREQWKYWSSLGRPSKFDRKALWFRKDLKF